MSNSFTSAKLDLCLLDESFLTDRFKNRTLVLSVTGIENNDDMDVRRSMKIRANLFTQIFKIFPHIQQLKFYESLPLSANFVYFTRRPSIFSSKLVELHVDLYSFQDLLYLIDGRFDHLQRLIVKLKNLWLIEPISVDGVRQKKTHPINIDLDLSSSL